RDLRRVHRLALSGRRLAPEPGHAARRVVVVRAVVLACVAVAVLSAQDLPRAGFIGVSVGPDPGGVLVTARVDGGSAKAAGIATGDVITQVGDRAVSGVDDFVQIARRLRGGDVALLHVTRKREDVIVKVPIRPRPYEHADGVDVRYDAIAV